MAPETFFERALAQNDNYLNIEMIDIDFHRCMTVARYVWGCLIETELTLPEGGMTLEVLATNDGVNATLISREQFDKQYQIVDLPTMRDDRFPVGCTIRLVPQKRVYNDWECSGSCG